MSSKSKISEYKKVEAQLSSVLIDISKRSEAYQKDFSFYWSKKSPITAASVYKVFAADSDIVLDPFVGSGSSLYGLKLFSNKMKFIGVDVNQLPIELIHFNMNALTLAQLENLSTKVKKFILENESTYHYHLNEGEAPFTFKKVHLNREFEKIDPILFVFARNKERLTLTQKDGEKFLYARNEYLNRLNNSIKLNQTLPDLLLITNSRIAIKSGMKLSDIFSPITFNILLKYRDLAIADSNLAIVLSSCLHLCRLTDTRSQSQFPFWVPTKEAVDRNILDLLQAKVDLLFRLNKETELKLNSLNIVNRVNTFENLSLASEPTYLLHHTPIQKLTNDQIPDESVDLVFTDPPYFDQVAYSEYLVIWEFFTGIISDLENEIVQSNREIYASDRNNYLKLMSEGFSVISKKLKEDHLAIVYFKDSKLNNIADFLQIMENSGLKYLQQIHLPKSKFTYKQNTSQESTVEGDSLYVFRKVKNLQKKKLAKMDKMELEHYVLRLIDEYIETHGSSTPSKILDDFLIPMLWKAKLLHLFTSNSVYQKLVNENFKIDRETRKIIGRV
jgi:DNA modification methylase